MTKRDEIKIFNMRMPRELWMFLRMEALLNEVSMNSIIIECVSKYKKKMEKKLTSEVIP